MGSPLLTDNRLTLARPNLRTATKNLATYSALATNTTCRSEGLIMGGQINTLADQAASSPTSDAAGEPALGEGIEALVRPKLHLTGKGLSPEDYRAKHGSHVHQARFD